MTNATPLARIAIVAGDTPASRAVAGAARSLLTAVGRWVVEVAPDADLAGHALVILPRGRAWRSVRARYDGPLLVVDGDLLDGRPDTAFTPHVGGAASEWIAVRDERMLVPRPLPTLAGSALGEVPLGLGVRVERGLGYVLPAMVSPAFRTVAGFWSLARALEESVAALTDATTVCYVEPWPAGHRAARALTCDMDDLVDDGVLAPLVAGGGAATLFICADTLDRLRVRAPQLEVAAHGDVHRPFADPRTNLERVDRMCAAFRAGGCALAGFSPPNLVYTSPLEPLLERFAHVRIGYQERGFGFFPTAVAGGVVTGVSYYPDYMHRYVGTDEYVRLLRRYCDWAVATSSLAVPCFHPAVFPDALRRWVETPSTPAWEATLADVATWWQRRAHAIETIATTDASALPADVVLVCATPAARLAALTPPDAMRAVPEQRRAARQVQIAGHAYRVVPPAPAPAAAVEVPLGAPWRAIGWLPGALRRRAARTLLPVANKNGLHAAFYADLGLVPDVAGGSLVLPVVAADEPLMLAAPAARDVRRLVGSTLRRLTPRPRGTEAVSHA